MQLHCVATSRPRHRARVCCERRCRARQQYGVFERAHEPLKFVANARARVPAPKRGGAGGQGRARKSAAESYKESVGVQYVCRVATCGFSWDSITAAMV